MGDVSCVCCLEEMSVLEYTVLVSDLTLSHVALPSFESAILGGPRHA